MTLTEFVLIVLVWAVVVLAVLWLRTFLNVRNLRGNVRQLDEDFWGLLDESERADERMDRHHLRILAVEDSRSRTADLDVPTIHRPVPKHFWRNR